jgi:peptidoglycan/LPS O-acetylase OafA/YrhL
MGSYRITPAASVYFDAWRGGSSIVVMLAHTIHIFAPGPFSGLASVVGAASVMAFFVLSGFFIHKSLMGCMRPSGFNIVAFARARVNRIVLPFLVCLMLTIALYFLAPYVFASGSHAFINPTARPDFSLDGLGSTALFVNEFLGSTLSANGPLWSLSYEVWYYTFLAASGLVVTGSRAGWLAAPFLVAAAALNHAFAILGVVWVAGCVLSICHSSNRLQRMSALRLPMFVLAMILAAHLLVTPTSRYGMTLFELAFGTWFALHLARVLQSAPNNLSVRTLAVTARFSYTLYLTHFPVLLFIFGALDDRTGVGALIAVPGAIFALTLAAIVGRVERVVLLPKQRPPAT